VDEDGTAFAGLVDRWCVRLAGAVIPFQVDVLFLASRHSRSRPSMSHRKSAIFRYSGVTPGSRSTIWHDRCLKWPR